ncbi:MAG: hypothetical protein IJD92_03010 [Bacilli bacterium]|nr:hypothetical protein [Bacilli bacterium]
MKKTSKKNVRRALLSITVGILVCMPLAVIEAWPVVILFGGICSIFPGAVILDKLGLIELVDVKRYKKIVDEKGNILYDDYENVKKVDANDYEKELRFADERKRANILFEDTYKKPIITKQTRENILNSPNLYSNCDIRVRMGKFYTDEEKEKYIEESLKRPLPGEEGLKLIKKWKPRNNK